MIAVKLHSFSGIKEHNNKDKQWSAVLSNNTAWNLAHSKETVKFIISINDGGLCIQWQNILEVTKLLSAKDAKKCFSNKVPFSHPFFFTIPGIRKSYLN